jgi:hypothetical protein
MNRFFIQWFSGFLLLLCISVLFVPVFGQTAKKEDAGKYLESPNGFPSFQSALHFYINEENPYIKAKLLHKVAAQVNPSQRFSFAELNSLDQMITAGLQDKYPEVIVATADLVSVLKRKDLESVLISKFIEANKFDPSYRERIKIGLIHSLGALGGTDTKELFKTVLEQESASPMSNAVLQSIQALDDPSLIIDVDRYSAKMKYIMAGKHYPEDHYGYNRISKSADLAAQVSATLSKKRGE